VDGAGITALHVVNVGDGVDGGSRGVMGMDKFSEEVRLRHCVSKLAHRDWLFNERFGLAEHRMRLEELVLVAGAIEHLCIRVASMKPLWQFVAPRIGRYMA
jgi:hypothetical protein